jgi:predicted secreted acid phosphatase
MKLLLGALPRVFFCLIISSNVFCTEPPNLGLIETEVVTYHDSGAYMRDFAIKIAEIETYLTAQIANYKDKEKPQKKLAIVLDIDETSLSNYDQMVKRHFMADAKQIDKEILAANDPAIKPTLALYEKALKNGIKVFFVTGRFVSERAATEKNLKNAGYTQWAGLYLRPSNYQQKSIIPFKSMTRAMIEQQGYLILATIGDQYSDIKGGHAEKGFKLPNPYYYIH